MRRVGRLSPEARAISLRIRSDADAFLRRAMLRIALMCPKVPRGNLLERYQAGEFGWWTEGAGRRNGLK